MYHPTSISQLSASQISKALKGLPVRVSVGNQHDIELSQEQLKKFAKAGQKGKAATITLDPFQIEKHMQMLGSGKLKKSIRADAARLITSGTDRAIRSIEGSGMLKKSIRADAGRLISSGTDRAIRAIEGSGMLKKSIRADAGRLITSGTDRAIRAIEGSGNMKDLYLRASMPDARKASARYGPNLGKSAATEDQEYNGPLYLGTGVNRLKKGQRWEHFVNASIRDGIDTAGKAARVYKKSTDPMSMLGFGLKKRGRPRKTGGALYVAGQN
jgi:hypothetical protein